MTTEQYKTAYKIQEEIARLVYELEILEQNLAKPTRIRFGTNYNVSIPIAFDFSIYINALAEQRQTHLTNIKQLKDKFSAL